jgi:hypothetical protein
MSKKTVKELNPIKAKKLVSDRALFDERVKTLNLVSTIPLGQV